MCIHTPLSRKFYKADTRQVARALLGKILVHETADGLCSGMIVETEAYLAEDDPGCHAARGKTDRNAAMFEAPGTAYVYLIYGIHYCLNIVTAPAEIAEAVLIRAVEPKAGIEIMRRRRNKQPLQALCSGPAKLCEAFDIDLQQNFADMTGGPLYVTGDDKASCEIPAANICTTTRVGLPEGKGDDLPLRYYLQDSEFVSRR